jgi:hypothetical protein
VFRLRVAGITLSIPGNGPFPEELRPFLRTRGGDIRLLVQEGPIPDAPPETLLFDSGGLWKVYAHGRTRLYRLQEPIPGSEPYGALSIDRSWSRGTLYSGPRRLEGAPIPYPLDELLFQHHLAFHRGLELHACGVVLDGKGVLFSGDSGAGKTTLARLFRAHSPGTLVLSDDRVALRERRGSFWSFGTPWHGSGRFASPAGRPLGAIFFLSHAPETRATRLRPAEAVERLFARAFVPRWDAAIVRRVLGVCGRLARGVPCFDLGVRPGRAALGMIAMALGASATPGRDRRGPRRALPR